MAQPPHPGPYAVRPVSDKVNNVRNDGPELLEKGRALVFGGIASHRFRIGRWNRRRRLEGLLERAQGNVPSRK